MVSISLNTKSSSIKVFLVCSGLGHIKRGFESFTQECFDALSQETSLDITLFKGGGRSSSKEITLWNLPREKWTAKLLAKLSNGKSYSNNPYFVEQASFCLSIIPYIFREKPDVIFFSDFALGTILWHWRRISKLSYKLLFSNGAPNGPPFTRMDHVQHLTPTHYQAALAVGELANKHSLVPYGIRIDKKYSPLGSVEQSALRQKLGLPIDRSVVLSVAAINKTHKRMDYLIQEVASLPEPRPYLLLLGQIDQESSEILELGHQLLGKTNFRADTVAPEELKDFYRAADIFVLASLNEGFGRVLLEAMANGLPCLAHDYEVAKFVLGNDGNFTDFTIKGNLARLIQQVLSQKIEQSNFLRYQSIYERFSWSVLKPRYIEMLHTVLKP